MTLCSEHVENYYGWIFCGCARDYLVVPIQWINDLKFERIVNNILNSSLKYRCFYSNRPEAQIGNIPNGEYAADFNAPLQEKYDDLAEACYISMLVTFYGKYSGWQKFLNISTKSVIILRCIYE